MYAQYQRMNMHEWIVFRYVKRSGSVPFDSRSFRYSYIFRNEFLIISSSDEIMDIFPSLSLPSASLCLSLCSGVRVHDGFWNMFWTRTLLYLHVDYYHVAFACLSRARTWISRVRTSKPSGSSCILALFWMDGGKPLCSEKKMNEQNILIRD